MLEGRIPTSISSSRWTCLTAQMDVLQAWFLIPEERGNPDTQIDKLRDPEIAWTLGNRCEALIHGATYFRRLYEAISNLNPRDWVHFTDWRGDPDERLAGPGTEVVEVLADAAHRGVQVRGLVWRSHPDLTKFSEEENLHLAQQVNAAGGIVLLDERVRRGGSHHQKLFVIRHMGDEDRDVAFVGGIDLCHSRNDDAEHRGDPQVYELDRAYGDRPPWHDAQMEVRGPAVNDLSVTFRERWTDPTPIDHRNPVRRMLMKRAHEPDDPGPLPPLPPDPSPCGTHAVQVLRTYPFRKPSYPFARNGERSIARAYDKAYGRARRLIYIEDQYLWSGAVARILAENLRGKPQLRLIVVVPRFPEKNDRLSGPPNIYGQWQAIETLKEAGGDRAAFYDIENAAGTPIYIHAKVCVIDDVWAVIGSDNINLRSWTHDSELSCAVIDEQRDGRSPTDPAGLGDGARVFARNLRLQLWREHLGQDSDDNLIDPAEGFLVWRQRASALDEWHRSGCRGPRPPGQVRVHAPRPLSRLEKLRAAPVYGTVVDPDGRPRSLRKRNEF